MRKTIILLIALLLSVPIFAQLEVKQGSFKEVPGFVNINSDPNYQTDDNDLPFAVIKVRTENITDKQRRELKFGGNAGTFILLEYKDGEVWVYLTAKYADYLKISHPDFSSIEFTIPFDLEPKKGYEMMLVNKAAPVQEGWGSLSITTKPENGSKVLLNGRLLPQNTPYKNDMIPSGKYEITVSKERFVTTTKTIEINDGENKLVEIEMPYAYGSLSIITEPSGGFVYIDDSLCGVTPIILHNIKIGTHEVKIDKDYYATLIKKVSIEENQILDISEKLNNGRNITILTDSHGDDIFVDDVFVGNAPVVTSVTVNHHVIKAVRRNNGVEKTVVKNISIAKIGDITIKLSFAPQGAINGRFSVNTNKQVYFSQGNLQYKASAKLWRFADKQYDFTQNVGKAKGRRNKNWIDLFGWGTSGYNKMYPYMISVDNKDYYIYGDRDISGTNYDWGVYNTVSNGGNAKWRTLTKNEWEYILFHRATRSNARFVMAKVHDVIGLILLPDDWEISNYELKAINIEKASFDYNQITDNDWINIFEFNGAVFLPVSGSMAGEWHMHYKEYAEYWSSSSYMDSTKYKGAFAYSLAIGKQHGISVLYGARCGGNCVRLVCDVE